MGNYVIEDENDDYSVSYNEVNNNSKKYIIIGLCVIIFIIFIIVIVKNINSSKSYSSYEKEMKSLAEEYVARNKIFTDKEIYFDISKLGMVLPNNCSSLSGVIYDGNNYQPYLLCNNYESKILDNSENIKLHGHDVVVLLKGMEYFELGYVGTEKVYISDKKINDEGVYNIYYIPEIGNYATIRKVIVIDNPNLEKYYPTININAENPIVIEKGNNYYEKVQAVDVIDGDLTNKIETISNVNELSSGEYKVIYNVRNSLGYETSIMKKIQVVDNIDVNIMISLSNENITNENITAHVKIIGDNYQFVKLPDNREINEKEFDYLITENGNYNFVVVLENGEEISKNLNITNIDKTVPTGNCTATLYNDKTSVNVKTTSFNYITGYNYYINSKSSGYLTHSSYESSTTGATSVYVMVRDYVGNESTFNCDIVKKTSNLDDNGIKVVIANKPRLRIPIEQALANRGHTVNDLNTCIYKRVQEAGPYTRYGVTAAAYGLIDCTYTLTGYVLSYNHTSGKVEDSYCAFNSDICGKLGINRRWGYSGGDCNASTCWHGLNCATFVRWAMCNGGMNLCSRGSAGAHSMTSTTYFPEANGVYIKGNKVTYYSGQNLTGLTAMALVRMLKPGDVVASTEGGGHTFVVVGRDEKGIYTAEDGYYMRHIWYSELLNGHETYRLLFLDNYYNNPANRNNLYG